MPSSGISPRGPQSISHQKSTEDPPAPTWGQRIYDFFANLFTGKKEADSSLADREIEKLTDKDFQRLNKSEFFTVSIDNADRADLTKEFETDLIKPKELADDEADNWETTPVNENGTRDSLITDKFFEGSKGFYDPVKADQYTLIGEYEEGTTKLINRKNNYDYYNKYTKDNHYDPNKGFSKFEEISKKNQKKRQDLDAINKPVVQQTVKSGKNDPVVQQPAKSETDASSKVKSQRKTKRVHWDKTYDKPVCHLSPRTQRHNRRPRSILAKSREPNRFKKISPHISDCD